MFEAFNPLTIPLTKYLFFAGKGGVGKTSAACAAAVAFADGKKRVLLISTDPASNLQDVFQMEISGSATQIKGVPGLSVVNIDPIKAAAEYRESVIAPYRGKLPESVLENMAEQLSGSCTVEIAAFDAFTNFIVHKKIKAEYDHIIFDMAPTGHTLRLLQLPSAWSGFLEDNTLGASCLGQLSGLESKRQDYAQAVETLSDGAMTTFILVTRPEEGPLKEAQRAFEELKDLGIQNQILVINGILMHHDDSVSGAMAQKQQQTLSALPEGLKHLNIYQIPLRAYNMTGIENIRRMLVSDYSAKDTVQPNFNHAAGLKDVIDDLFKTGKRVIFVMGKGGVGKTTIAAAIALGLVEKGAKVHLTTTDPAAHLKNVIDKGTGMTVSHIDEKKELKKYSDEVLAKARETMGEDDLAYVKEDLRSPCTQEIAVFRAFAQIVDRAEEEVVVIDTAPTGHTLLLLDATQSYHRQIKNAQGAVPEPVAKLLPRLKNSAETEVLIVTLAEATPVYEAMRLEDDLLRAGIYAKWWIINSSLFAAQSTNGLLASKANSEIEWINRVNTHSKGKFAVIPWMPEELKGNKLKKLYK